MNALYRLLHPLHRVLVRWLELVTMAILAFLVADVLLGVFSRFVVGEQVRWTEEVAIYLLVWVTFLGGAAAYAENAHLGVDYMVEKFPVSLRTLSYRIVHLIVLLFAFFGLLLGGGRLMVRALEGGQVTPAMQMPMGWIYSVVPLSGLLFILFALHALVAPAESADLSRTNETPTDV